MAKRTVTENPPFILKKSGEQIDEALGISLQLKDNVSTLMELGESDGRLLFRGQELQSGSTARKILYFTNISGTPLLSTEIPGSNVVVVPTTWFGADPGVWQPIATIGHSVDIASNTHEFITGEHFSATVWLVSEMPQTNAQIRLQAINTNDGSVLASATTKINLSSDGLIPTPVNLNGTYQQLIKLPLSDVTNVISIMPTTFGLQVGIISNPPNEISFINTLSTSGGDDQTLENYRGINDIELGQGLYPVTLFEKTGDGFVRNDNGFGDHILVSTPGGGYNLMPLPNTQI